MKHIRSYTLFEGVSKETKVFESTKDDIESIKDICLDITDDGEFAIEIIEKYEGDIDAKSRFGVKGPVGFVLIKRTDGTYGSRIAFNYKDIKNTTNMIKNYLEDRYIKSMVMLSGSMNWLDLDDRKEPYWRLVDPHKDSGELIYRGTKINNNINENGIKYFVIWFKNT